METKYTTAGREWKVGERVIVLSTHPSYPAPRVLRIQTVAEKSFVVDGERYRRDKLESGVPIRWTGSDWGRFSVKILPLDHPDAELNLAQRAVYKQGRLVEAAQREFNAERSAVHAKALRDELAEWIKAAEALDAVEAKRRGR